MSLSPACPQCGTITIVGELGRRCLNCGHTFDPFAHHETLALPILNNQRISEHDWLADGLPLIAPADLIIADPPYNIGIEYADDPTNDSLDPNSYHRHLVEKPMSYAYECLEPGGTLAWICPAQHGPAVWATLLKLGFRLHKDAPVIWHETFSQYQRHSLTCDYRLIFLAHKRGPLRIENLDAIRIESERQRAGDKRANPEGRVPGMVWNIRRLQGTSTSRSGKFPTELPPELLDRLVLGWSRPAHKVMDLFAGSGSCGLSCIRNGRSFQGWERSPTYILEASLRLLAAGAT
jgi:DNA modification methylase